MQVEAPAEALNATSRVQYALLAGEEWVTLGAYINLKYRLDAQRLECIATGTTHCGLDIIWMDSLFHDSLQILNSIVVARFCVLCSPAPSLPIKNILRKHDCTCV